MAFRTPRVGTQGTSRSRHPALPAPVAGWPIVAWDDPEGDRLRTAQLERIRSELLWWPVPSHDAGCHVDPDLSAIDPLKVDEKMWPSDHAARRLFAYAKEDPDLLPRISWTCPWRGHSVTSDEGLEALSFLAAAARANDRPRHLVGMSPWKRRCVRPFLTGPHGRPKIAARPSSQPVFWGNPDGRHPQPSQALWIEDGFLRSVGLGLQHVPPVSLVVDQSPLYFDATRRNGFEEIVARARFEPDLLARAANLRKRILELRLSKYNLCGTGADLPRPARGQQALLVVGQVENDASLRFGGTAVRTNLELLRAAREAYPAAFILYKPHPDTLTGLRDGGDITQAERLADHVERMASAPDCIEWADRIATITSLLGFEALLRGKKVVTFGRPFYGGWGLTDDRDPPARDRRLTLDELTAAALILYPRYIDPTTGLPAPPEIVVEALAAERDAPATLQRWLRHLWRYGVSWTMNNLPRGAA